MATVVNFQGKNYVEPGAYAAIVYNPTSVANVAEFGNVMIIDTGLSFNTVGGQQLEFAGGSGIKGQLAQGLKAVYEFTDYEDFLSFMGGGLVGDIAEKIFTPRAGVLGAPKLYYARAATTTPAVIALTVATTGSGTEQDPTVNHQLVLTCKNEGVVGNGYAVEGVLKAGYAAKIITGSAAGKFRVQILKGQFAGQDAAGEPFGAYSLAAAPVNILAESEDLATLQEAYNWAISNKMVNAAFKVEMNGDGTKPLIAIAQTLAAGGTTVYLNNAEYAAVLEAITELDITFFLCTNLNADSGAGVDANSNAKLFTYLKSEDVKFTEFMVVPGGADDTDLFGSANCSEAIAKYYDSEQVITVHGSPVVERKDKTGTKALEPIYLAADIIGMAAGAAPQTPLTFKRTGYNSFVYDLKKKERVKALQAGILHVRNISGNWCVNQGINTLQNNLLTVAPDGQTFEISIALIKAQINKELIIEGERRYTGQTVAQASPEAVKNFTETKLASFVATPGNDNLIISWNNVKVSAQNGDYRVTYDFVPNVPLNKMFFVGNMLDFTF